MSEDYGERLLHGPGGSRGFDCLAVYRVAAYRRENL